MRQIVISKKILIAIFVVLGLVAVGLGYIVYSERQKVTAQNTQNEVQTLVNELAAFTDLPNEQPTVATVTDKEKLKQYPFFTKSEIGDKVLIFNEAKKAYLYRPTTKKLIEVGPIQLTDTAATSSGVLSESTQSASPAAEQKQSSLTILNGTKTSGLASKIQKQIESDESLKIVKVSSKGNAKKDHQKTLLIVNNQAASAASQSLAKTLNAEITQLPEGEDKPTTDLLLILGEDKK